MCLGGVVVICCIDECEIEPLHIVIDISQHRSDAPRIESTKDSASLCPKNYLEIAACTLFFCTLRYSLVLANRPWTESFGLQFSIVFNPDKGYLESHDSLRPENNYGIEVQNEAMIAMFFNVFRTLASLISLL